jgi:hypothetical protein
MNSKYTIEIGDDVYLLKSLKVIRRTKEGRLLCQLYDREISIPETMLINTEGKHFLNKCGIKV